MYVTEEAEGQMSKQSGFMLRKEQEKEELLSRAQNIVIQYMIDTLQITLRNDYGWGYDRIMKLTEAWKDTRQYYKAAVEPRDKMADVMQEKMQRAFQDICAYKKIEPIPFSLRYPYLKGIRYDRKYK
jgi:hypothetical protein